MISKNKLFMGLLALSIGFSAMGEPTKPRKKFSIFSSLWNKGKNSDVIDATGYAFTANPFNLLLPGSIIGSFVSFFHYKKGVRTKSAGRQVLSLLASGLCGFFGYKSGVSTHRDINKYVYGRRKGFWDSWLGWETAARFEKDKKAGHITQTVRVKGQDGTYRDEIYHAPTYFGGSNIQEAEEGFMTQP